MSMFRYADISMLVRMFANGRESYQRLKTWYLIPPCLTLSIISYGSRVKWSNPGKGVAPSPTPWCSSYQKGSFWITLKYGRQHANVYILLSGRCKLRLLVYYIFDSGSIADFSNTGARTSTSADIKLNQNWTHIPNTCHPAQEKNCTLVWFLCLMAYQFFLGYLMPNPFS